MHGWGQCVPCNCIDSSHFLSRTVLALVHGKAKFHNIKPIYEVAFLVLTLKLRSKDISDKRRGGGGWYPYFTDDPLMENPAYALYLLVMINLKDYDSLNSSKVYLQ